MQAASWQLKSRRNDLFSRTSFARSHVTRIRARNHKTSDTTIPGSWPGVAENHTRGALSVRTIEGRELQTRSCSLWRIFLNLSINMTRKRSPGSFSFPNWYLAGNLTLDAAPQAAVAVPDVSGQAANRRIGTGLPGPS